MTPRIELVYDPDCPSVEQARETLAGALRDVGLPLRWIEWNTADPDRPEHTEDLGSPTIRVDGRDVQPARDGSGPSCRLYVDGSGRFRGVPSRESIVYALRSGERPDPRAGS